MRAAARAYPDRVLIGLDIKNAFGQVQWADALLAAAAKSPKLAVPMATMMSGGQLHVHLQDAVGRGWHSFLISPPAQVESLES